MKTFKDPLEVARAIVDEVGSDIRLAIPLGAGKPNHIVNALYQLVKDDKKLKMTILTALTLNKPEGASLLETRFMGPFADRVFGDYPNLLFEEDRQKQNLPENIDVIEFYFQAGKHLNNKYSQSHYISTNYTHVSRDLTDFGVNVIAHLVASDETGEYISLSCNADVTTDLIGLLKSQGKKFVFCAQVNSHLPYMYGDAALKIEEFDFILENEEIHFPIFAPPKLSVSDADHLIGFYASTLIKDDGELQVGIGSLGDALVSSLLLRHNQQELYLKCIEIFNVKGRYESLIEKKGELSPFKVGLFGATEMLVDGFMHLINAEILKKKVYDDVILQHLLNEGLVDEKVSEKTLYYLLEKRAIQPKLTLNDFKKLQKFGILKEDLNFENGFILNPKGERIEADCNKDENLKAIIKNYLGDYLKSGAIVHGGFFLGCNDFYNWLRALPEEQKKLIHMKSVIKINQLYGHEELDRLHRKNARFVNTCLMMTLSGAAVSDGLEDGRVVSGVGGQYNFVAMAHALPDGHSVIQLRSTRMEKGKLKSNIVFNYGHITIPRHLRDIVITEYGIADIRGKTDSDVASALIEIADSRFQDELINKAKSVGKLKPDYVLPEFAKKNLPEELDKKLKPLKELGLFPKFPFGTELTDLEIQIGAALKSLKKKQHQKGEMILLLVKSLFVNTKKHHEALKRMGLNEPKNFKEYLYQRLLASELN